MAQNKTVLVGGGIIITVGYANAVVTKGNPTRVIVGGMVFILLASLLELAGPRASAIASGIVGIAVLTVVLVEAPSIQQAVTNAQANAPNPSNAGATAQNQAAGPGAPGSTQPPAPSPGGGHPY